MCEIQQYYREGVTIPLFLAVKVDGIAVEYRRRTGSFLFIVSTTDRTQALNIVKELSDRIVEEQTKICLPGQTKWVSDSLRVEHVSKAFPAVHVSWKYHLERIEGE
jgi:hypothetical protein